MLRWVEALPIFSRQRYWVNVNVSYYPVECTGTRDIGLWLLDIRPRFFGSNTIENELTERFCEHRSASIAE